MPMSPGLNRRRGIFGAAQPAPTMAEEPQKPKFFGEGGTGRTIAGVLGDALAQLGGFDPVFAPEMQRRREMASALRQQEQQRQQGLQDWVWKQQYERDNPKPTAPHYWETNDGSLGMVGPDGKPQIIYQDPTEKIQWMQVDNGDGTKTVIPYNSKGPLGQQPQAGMPQQPKGKLTPYNGGQSATPTGSFPR